MGTSLERDPNPYSAYWGSRLSPPVTKASLVFLTPVYYGFFYLQVDAQTAIPEWEIIPDFNPRQVVLNSVHWVDKDAKPTTQNEHLPKEYINDVISGALQGQLNNLAFRDHQQFVSGRLHNHYDRRCDIALQSAEEAHAVLDWISHGVDVYEYFRHFHGSYKGTNYDSDLPPRKIFPNNISCKPFCDFISQSIIGRITSGAISVWGKVGEVAPPYLVMPLTVEPSKPRLCKDNRFLNLWMIDKPFHLDRLTGIPRYVTNDSFQSVTNDKSGYDHVFLTSRSRTFLFVACFTLTSLEYFIGLQKCILFPRQEVPNTLIPVKKAKFLALLRGILQRVTTEVVCLQKLAGKCNSMSLAIPGGRLFTNEMNLAISQGVRSSRPVKISPSLRSEMQHWLFLENWEGHLPWLSERHSHIQLCTDASSFGWGGVQVRVRSRLLFRTIGVQSIYPWALLPRKPLLWLRCLNLLELIFLTPGLTCSQTVRLLFMLGRGKAQNPSLCSTLSRIYLLNT